jgi:hypothetical protein
MSKNMMEADGFPNDVTIWRMRFACWIRKATCTYAHPHAYAPEYPHTRTQAHACTHWQINNTYYFSTAKIIRDRASMLRYTYIISILYLLPTQHSGYSHKYTLRSPEFKSYSVKSIYRKCVNQLVSNCLSPQTLYTSYQTISCALTRFKNISDIKKQWVLKKFIAFN